MTLLPLLLSLLAVGPDGAQAPQAPLPLGAVTVTGARRYTEADVTRLSGLKPGQTITPAELEPSSNRWPARDCLPA